MKNTCWFFGDSFTQGHNCHKGDEYYEKTYKDGCKIWTTIVSEKLNCKEVNTAEGGMSNMAIITQIITNMSKMKKDDYAIITNTLVHRVLAFKDNGDFINIINDIKNGYVRGSSKHECVIDYIFYEIFPHSEYYAKWYLSLYEGLIEELKLRKVKTIFWPADLWYPIRDCKFHKIIDDVPSIKDSHFSWRGHEQFSQYILNEINGKEKLI